MDQKMIYVYYVYLLLLCQTDIVSANLTDHYELGRCAVHRDSQTLLLLKSNEDYLKKFLLGFHHPKSIIVGLELDDTVLRGKKYGMLYQSLFEIMVCQNEGMSPTPRIVPINDPPGSIGYIFPDRSNPLHGYHELDNQYFEYFHDEKRFLDGLVSAINEYHRSRFQSPLLKEERAKCNSMSRSLKYRQFFPKQKKPLFPNSFINHERCSRFKKILQRDFNNLKWSNNDF